MNKLSTLILTLLSLVSCTVYKEFPVDIYKPGEAEIPANAQKVALIYRNFKYDNDTLKHYYRDNHLLKKAKGDPPNLDSLLATICLNEAAITLKKNYENKEFLIFADVFKPHAAAKIPQLNPSVLSGLAETTKTDYIILLETHSYFYSEYKDDEGGPSPRQVITADVWSAFDPSTQKFRDRETMIDTVFWNAYKDDGTLDRNSKLPPRLAALKIASRMAGDKYAKRYTASWANTKRIYSVPPLPDFEAAEKYVLKGDWDNAIQLWRKYTGNKDGKLAINARYNMAFACEMKDDFDGALQWLSSARQMAEEYHNRENLKMIDDYKKILLQRKKDIERLNQEQ